MKHPLASSVQYHLRHAWESHVRARPMTSVPGGLVSLDMSGGRSLVVRVVAEGCRAFSWLRSQVIGPSCCMTTSTEPCSATFDGVSTVSPGCRRRSLLPNSLEGGPPSGGLLAVRLARDGHQHRKSAFG